MAGAVVLSAFLQVVFEKTASLLIHQFKGTWGTVDVHKELTKLHDTLMAVQAVLEDAEEQQLENRAITLWLSNLKHASYEADDIIDDFQWEVLRKDTKSNMKTMVRHFFSPENPLLFRIRMGHRIKQVVERFDAIAKRKSDFHFNATTTNYGIMLQGESSTPQTYSFVVEQNVVGRREDVTNIVEMLIGQENSDNDSLAVLPIVGMGGLGKTTVAQMVYNEPRVRQHFQLHMWICVSEDFNVVNLAKKILDESAKKGNPSGAGSSMESVQQSLREKLSSKRYLLVLDDVWNEAISKWEELKDLLAVGARGSVVVVTTRNREIGSIMGTLGRPYMLSHLSEVECWDLFRQRAFAGGREEDPELVEIGKRIVSKFGGLPLAAKTVGSLMRLKKEKWEWSAVLNSELWDIKPGNDEILPALKISYNHLPPYLKQCFAFCAMFPKDCILWNGTLIQLWMANGLIPSQGNMELEDRGHEIFNDLASRSFFQDVKEVDFNYYSDFFTTKTCRMHDLIHDLAKNVMGDECCILETSKQLDTSLLNVKNVLHLYISHSGSETYKRTVAKTVTKLTRIRTLSEPGVLSLHLQGRFCWNSLRALHCRYDMLTDGLICKLKHLRYLDLSGCRYESLPEGITSLYHLKTLKLEYCDKLTRLPKSLKNMKSLRHLFLHGSTGNFNFMPDGMGTLSSLRTLSDYVVGDVSGNIRELKNLNSIGGCLSLMKLENVKDGANAKEANLIAKEKLTVLDLSWYTKVSELEENVIVGNSEEVVEALRPHQNIRYLSIRGYRGNFPNWLMKCLLYLPNLVKVTLHGCVHCEHLPLLGHLPFLDKLILSGMNAIRCMDANTFYGDGGDSLFPRLKSLYISNMPNLEEWRGAQVAFFPQLTDLTLANCPKLKSIPCIPSVQFFYLRRTHLLPLDKRFFENMTSMERLKIWNCNQLFSLTDILTCDLGSLREISFRGCPNLIDSSSSNGGGTQQQQQQQQQQQHQYLTSLERLKIEGSEKLACLPHYIGSLARLKYLRITDCNHLASLGNGLAGLVELEQLEIERFLNLTAFPDDLGLLPALSTLCVSYCDNLTVLSQGLGGFNMLTKLSIHSCSKLTSLPNSLLQRLPNLRELKIHDCPDLQSQFGEGGVYRDIVSNIPQSQHKDDDDSSNNGSSLMSNLCCICLRGGGST